MKEIQILNNGDTLHDIRTKINENFELMKEGVEQGVTDPLAKFGVNEGNETDGVADLLNIEEGTLSFKVGGEYPNLVMTSGDGVTTQIESINDLHLQNLADGEYTVVVNGSNSNITDAEFYSQLLEPENPNNGDVWFNGTAAYQYLTNAPSVSEVTPKSNINYLCMGNVGDFYIAAGSGNVLYYSNDGGTSWQTYTVASIVNTQSFVSCAVKDNYIFLLSNNGSLYKTSNLEDWDDVYDFTAGAFPQVLTIIEDFYFVLGSSGKLFYNTIDGNGWKSVQVGSEPLINIYEINGLYYVVNRAGAFYTSTDLETWEQVAKITQETAVLCSVVYKDSIILGGISGSLYIYNYVTNTITLKNLNTQSAINDMQIGPNGAIIFVGTNNLCKITYDLETYQNLNTSGGYLTHIYKNFILGQAGKLLRIDQTIQWIPYPYIPIGEVIINGGQVTYYNTYPYNTNGLHEASSSSFGLLRTAAVVDELNCHCSDAVLTPANLYSLNNYRTMNTAYEEGDKVGCPYHHNLQLKCTKAGVTSNEKLDTKGELEPTSTIKDGTVTWEVEELGTGGAGSDPTLNRKTMTNCWTKIPQRIKHTLKDGSLTILAGSELIFPYGTKYNAQTFGSLTNNNGVLNQFSKTSYAKLPKSVNLGNNFEIVFKITTGEDVTSASRIIDGLTNQYLVIHIAEDTNCFAYAIGDGTQWLNPETSQMTGKNSITTNTDYKIKVTFDGNIYKAYISTEENVWVDDWEFESTAIIPEHELLIGIDRTLASTFHLGSIDLNESYIKINNEIWWQGIRNLEEECPIGSTFLNDNLKVVDIYDDGNKFFVWAELQVDRTVKTTANATNTVLLLSDNSGATYLAKHYSGNTDPSAGTTWRYWYDIQNNHVKKFENDGTTPISNYHSLPLCLFTGDTTGVKKIHHTFNGWGYIGGVRWWEALEGLASIGYNEDGTYKNIVIKTPKITMGSYGNTTTRDFVILQNGGSFSPDNSRCFHQEEEPNITGTTSNNWYNPKANKTYQFNGTNWVETPGLKLYTYKTDGTNVTVVTDTPQTFRPVDYFELKSSLKEVQVVTETYRNGSSWYRIWSDGWCEQGGILNSTSSSVTVNLLKSYSDTQYSVILTPFMSSSHTGGSNQAEMYHTKNINSFIVSHHTSVSGFDWRACGYIK